MASRPVARKKRITNNGKGVRRGGKVGNRKVGRR